MQTRTKTIDQNCQERSSDTKNEIPQHVLTVLDVSVAHSRRKPRRTPYNQSQGHDIGLIWDCYLRLLLVDDDRGMCDLLQSYLVVAGFLVDTVHCGHSALQACRQRDYDIILLDVMLPLLDGYAVLDRLRSTSQVPVIMLTAKGDEHDRIKGLDAGADDYIAKPFSSRELVARINALLRRANSDAHQLVEQIGDLKFRPGHNLVEVGDTEVRLTSAEASALRTLCRHAGNPVSREHLSRVVLQRENSPFNRSLDTHMSNLRRKLGTRADGTKRITSVRSVGYQYCP